MLHNTTGPSFVRVGKQPPYFIMLLHVTHVYGFPMFAPCPIIHMIPHNIFRTHPGFSMKLFLRIQLHHDEFTLTKLGPFILLYNKSLSTRIQQPEIMVYDIITNWLPISSHNFGEPTMIEHTSDKHRSFIACVHKAYFSEDTA